MAGEEEAGPDLERELLLEERGESQRSGGGGAGAARFGPSFPSSYYSHVSPVSRPFVPAQTSFPA